MIDIQFVVDAGVLVAALFKDGVEVSRLAATDDRFKGKTQDEILDALCAWVEEEMKR